MIAGGRKFALLAGICGAVLLPGAGQACAKSDLSILVFTKTAGYRHDSIPAGIALLHRLGRDCGFSVTATEEAAMFSEDLLTEFDAVVWLNSTGDVLDGAQQAAFEQFTQKGGGFVGVHSAADTEYDWHWYGELIGHTWVRSHPDIQAAEVVVQDPDHPATAGLPAVFEMTEEWYNFRAQPAAGSRILLTLNEASYRTGADAMGWHPIAWSREIGEGRAFYTAIGHRDETYSDWRFTRHLLGGVYWAAGRDSAPAACLPAQALQ